VSRSLAEGNPAAVAGDGARVLCPASTLLDIRISLAGKPIRTREAAHDRRKDALITRTDESMCDDFRRG
jgi:hypothetical protein